MSSKTSTGRRLPRVLTEALAIFLGVGAALAGQAWYESRMERRAEQELLLSVHDELLEVEQTLSDLQVWVEERRQLGMRLVGALSQPVTSVRSDTVAALAPLMFMVQRSDWLEPWDALLGPANLTLVRDSGLRLELTGFRNRLAEVGAALDQQREFVSTEWRPFGLEYLDFRVGRGFWVAEPEPPPTSRHVRDGRRLVESPVFENLVDLTIMQYGVVRRNTEEATGLIPSLKSSVSTRLAAL